MPSCDGFHSFVDNVLGCSLRFDLFDDNFLSCPLRLRTPHDLLKVV